VVKDQAVFFSLPLLVTDPEACYFGGTDPGQRCNSMDHG